MYLFSLYTRNARDKVEFNLLLLGAVMKKTALAVTLISALLFSAVTATLVVRFADADPYVIWPKVSFPTMEVTSPIEGQFYPSSDVWLKFTVNRPEDWFYISSLDNGSEVYLSQGQIKFVIYSVDGAIDGVADEHESEKIYVNDPVNAVNPPSNFSLSFNLEGLQDGQHSVDVYAEGFVNGSGVGVDPQRINFTVYTPEPEPFPATMVAAAAGASATIVAIGLLVYFKKRNGGKNLRSEQH
jgi:hypothetical protein